MHVALIVLGAAAGGVGWYGYARLYPWRDCPRCGGARRNKLGYAHRDCKRCGSTGRVRRWGAGSGEL